MQQPGQNPQHQMDPSADNMPIWPGVQLVATNSRDPAPIQDPSQAFQKLMTTQQDTSNPENHKQAIQMLKQRQRAHSCMNRAVAGGMVNDRDPNSMVPNAGNMPIWPGVQRVATNSQDPAPFQVPKQVLQQIMITLKDTSNPENHRQAMRSLKSNPVLMAAFIKYRQQGQGATHFEWPTATTTITNQWER